LADGLGERARARFAALIALAVDWLRAAGRLSVHRFGQARQRRFGGAGRPLAGTPRAHRLDELTFDLSLPDGASVSASALGTVLAPPLADDDPQSARHRETLRVFLSEKGSFKATAEKLTLHKNTVQYRVRRAEEVLGSPVDENRLQIELALLACRWLGAAVLQTGPHRP